uniref:Uncharacterized protein n=1 Tax=Anopheles minimus TaxID=112268 RepID=A0A182WMT7_9DIPT
MCVGCSNVLVLPLTPQPNNQLKIIKCQLG